jgi:hypothetical protein
METAVATGPDPFIQRKVNHVFHYTDSLDRVLGIIDQGFLPSYCYETFGEMEYYIPMVSFCNIPLTEVSLYLRYGQYGIGLTLDWAISHTISPVVYVHERTPFLDMHRKINERHIKPLVKKQIKHGVERALDPSVPENDFSEEIALIKEINDITVPAIQFFKNWTTQFEGREIITYLEREWRFVPDLPPGERLVASGEKEHFADIRERRKPHFPDHPLGFELRELRYFLVEKEEQRSAILAALEKRFSPPSVREAIMSGHLMIVTKEQIRNDF